ncbi:hypothetical protein F4802DRAFT_610865 [Xylaria palmicola]|nr:hypothetical protein F4802DRAFT_610865 [Xylaria palmicola]
MRLKAGGVGCWLLAAGYSALLSSQRRLIQCLCQMMAWSIWQQLQLLRRATADNKLSEVNTAPLFTPPVLQYARRQGVTASTKSLSQYGLLAGDVKLLETPDEDPRIYYNVASPSSVFICGSQGSGKSHTLSCILENCLIPSRRIGHLPRPLTGIVFHYDDYTSDSQVAPCEAAYLGSDPAVKVRVLCSPTNKRVIEGSYGSIGNLKVEELRLDQTDLNTKRMLELMAFDRAQPLYAQVIQRILREMRLGQQTKEHGKFNYHDFLAKLGKAELKPDQKLGLQQRLELLQSFMVPGQVERKCDDRVRLGTDWTPKAGELIIVDLSCPCVTASMACALFNICLSIFLEQNASLGRVIALDEAHRYMGQTSDCEVLTNSLLAAIRFQRHLGARIVISTQEPTVSPKLLDLCSITIVHRFSSPDWLNALTKHIAGISKVSRVANRADGAAADEEHTGFGLRGLEASLEDPILELFSQIVALPTGEALVFAPSAMVSLDGQDSSGQSNKGMPKKLAHRVLRVRIRDRITTDGGRSVMAS